MPKKNFNNVEKFEVTILGCGSALPTLRHGGSAQIVNVREKCFLVDCAEGTQVALRREHVHLGRLFCVFLSHLHGDHCFGLLGLISTLGLLGRTAPLHVYGPADTERVFRPQLDYFCKDNPFDVVFHAVDTHAAAIVYEDRSVTITALPLRHRVPTVGYLFREHPTLPHIRPEAIVQYGIPVWQINSIKAGANFTTTEGTIIPHTALTTPSAAVRAYAYVSDTEFKPSLAEQLSGVDLLYHEATFAETEAALCTRVHHSTATQAARIASLAGAKRLALGHFSVRYEDESVLLDEAQAVFPNTVLANEGLRLDV